MSSLAAEPVAQAHTPAPFAQITARDIMQADPVCVHPDQSLIELRRLLHQSHVTGAPVVEGGCLVGVVSRTDITRMEDLMEVLDGAVTDEAGYLDHQADGFQHVNHDAFDGFRRRLSSLRVRDAMRTQVITCQRDTPVSEIAAEMVRHHVHRLVVVEGNRPVGIVSTLDVAELIARGS